MSLLIVWRAAERAALHVFPLVFLYGLPVAGLSTYGAVFGGEPKLNMPPRSNWTPSWWSSGSRIRSNDPAIPGRCQLYSTKLMIEDWSLRLWST